MFANTAFATTIWVDVEAMAVTRVVGGLIDKTIVPLVRVQSATLPKYAFGTELNEYVELAATGSLLRSE